MTRPVTSETAYGGEPGASPLKGLSELARLGRGRRRRAASAPRRRSRSRTGGLTTGRASSVELVATDLADAWVVNSLARTCPPVRERPRRHLLDRRPRPGTGELGVAVQSHWFSVGSIVPGRGPGSAPWRRSRSPSRPTGRGCSIGSRPARSRRARSARSSRRTRPRFARWRSSTARAHRGPHRARVHRRGRAHRGRRVRRPGEHDGHGRRLAGDGRGVRGGRRALARRLLAALEAAEARGETSADASRRRCSSSPPRASRGRAEVELRVEDSPEPLGRAARLLDLQDAYELADRADALAGEGAHGGPPSSTARRRRPRPRASSSASGPASGSPPPATSTAARSASRRRSTQARAGRAARAPRARDRPSAAAARAELGISKGRLGAGGERPGVLAIAGCPGRWA